MTLSRANASAATLTKNRTEGSVHPSSGMCVTCVDGCIGMCEIGKSAYRGHEVIYPQPFGVITTAAEKDYPVDYNSDIYIYNITTRQETQVTTNDQSQFAPEIFGNYIIWLDYRSGKSEVWLYNLITGTEKVISNNDENCTYCKIYGDIVIWRAKVNNSDHLFKYDITTEKIIELDFIFKGLTKLPEAIKHLTNLKKLTLRYNQITELPDWIESLLALESLNLNINNINKLPATIGSLLNLKELLLWKNELQDLPNSICFLQSLEHLNLRLNQLKLLPHDLGNLIIIDHLNSYLTFYGHNQILLKKERSPIKKGKLIALLGNSGKSTAPHLHFEIWKNGRPFDPAEYLIAFQNR